MKYAVKPRREVGIRTVFNMLGPLANPAGATAQLIGVYDAKLTEVVASVLKRLGAKRAFVVHGADGLDEATVTAETRVSELNDGMISTYNIDPVSLFGVTYSPEELLGKDADTNARITTEVLSGAEGAARDIVLLNAGLAIVAGEKVRTLQKGIDVAKESIDGGLAMKKLRGLVEISNS